MSQQERSRKTREDLLLAASHLINERPWSQSLVKDIANKAGYTSGAMYFHFAVKDQIALAIIEEQNKRSQRAAARIAEQALPGVETILQTITQFTRDLLDDPLIEAGIRLTTQPQMFEKPPVLPWTSWVAVHAQNLSRGIQEGDIKPDLDVHRYATHFTAAYAGTFILSGLTTGLTDLMERVSDLSIVLISSYVILHKQEYWTTRALEVCGAERSPERNNQSR